jgi:predicted nicotinamide N-methyase
MVKESMARETMFAGVGARAGDVGGDLTGLRVWEAAPTLIRHLERHPSRLLHSKTVLDAGSGTGAVGLAAAAFGAAHVVLSDADSAATMSTELGWQESSVLQTLRDNVALNGEPVRSRVSVAELRWGDAAHAAALRRRFPSGFDTIVSSDTLYYNPEDTYDALAWTIRTLAAESARVVLAYMVRHGQEHALVDMLISGGHAGGPCGRAARAHHDAESGEGEVKMVPRFELLGQNAAEEFSRTAINSHAPRVVELVRAQ